MMTSIGELTLANAHEQTSKRILGPNATPQERAAFKRAFYVGARAMHGLMLIAGTYPSGRAELAMEALENEIREFDRSTENPFLGG